MKGVLFDSDLEIIQFLLFLGMQACCNQLLHSYPDCILFSATDWLFSKDFFFNFFFAKEHYFDHKITINLRNREQEYKAEKWASKEKHLFKMYVPW